MSEPSARTPRARTVAPPPDPDPDALEAGRKLFAGPCDFVAGAASVERLPPDGPPEVAIAGRSNVGKSSLINALTGRKTLARTSNTPGRTQQLNFFALGGDGRPRLHLVDLPGYGYAKVPKATVDAWTRLLKTYLRGRTGLRRALVLVDARHGLKPPDLDILGLLDGAAVSTLVVLTKADKVADTALGATAAGVEAALAGHPAALPHVLVTSARDGRGIDVLRAHLAELASPGGFV